MTVGTSSLVKQQVRDETRCVLDEEEVEEEKKEEEEARSFEISQIQCLKKKWLLTNRGVYRQTDIPSHRDAWTHLKPDVKEESLVSDQPPQM